MIAAMRLAGSTGASPPPAASPLGDGGTMFCPRMTFLPSRPMAAALAPPVAENDQPPGASGVGVGCAVSTSPAEDCAAPLTIPDGRVSPAAVATAVRARARGSDDSSGAGGCGVSSWVSVTSATS